RRSLFVSGVQTCALPIVVVPELADLRKVPALSKRGEPPLEPRIWEFWTSKSAPTRLVNTELFNEKFAVPVQLTVPPFSKGRPSRSEERRVGQERSARRAA